MAVFRKNSTVSETTGGLQEDSADQRRNFQPNSATVNSTLTIKSCGTLVSDDEQTANSAQETAYDNETKPTRDAIHLRWSSFRFAEFFEGILAILTGLYLIGAVGFGAILFFYTFHH
jgi:hypothetical protein